MPRYLFITLFLLITFHLSLAGQQRDSIVSPLSFTGDFRFRIEHDWNSRRPDGSYRTNRSRLRYRFRFGLNYQLNHWASFGGRVRTGNLNDQQGPHVTLGGSTGEFRLVSLGFEKLFFQYKKDRISGWIGKNTFPFKKLNELFWNDNVFPEGVALRWQIPVDQVPYVDQLRLNAAHFIIASRNTTFDQDSYMQGIQLVSTHWQKRLQLFPGFYSFNALSNIPDGQGTYSMPYRILHLGGNVKLIDQWPLELGFDYYHNMESYMAMDSVSTQLKDQNQGYVVSLKWGKLRQKNDWHVHLYYAYLERFSIVDYFAQNDWARWDYSNFQATGSRLSNFQGVEINIGYAFDQQFNLILRTYFVQQLVPYGAVRENGDRIRLDLNIKF